VSVQPKLGGIQPSANERRANQVCVDTDVSATPFKAKIAAGEIIARPSRSWGTGNDSTTAARQARSRREGCGHDCGEHSGAESVKSVPESLIICLLTNNKCKIRWGRMKKGSAVFLQVILALFGMGALIFLLGEPHLEGRNAHATVFEVYFKDPFLAYVYLASIAFFTGLYQAIKVLGYAGRDRIFSQEAVNALRTIKYCALAMIAFVAVSVIFMPLGAPEDDDGPQGVVMRGVVIFGSIVVAMMAAMFERILKNAVDIKSENDLTV
jgi:hypothetical protein